MPSESAQKLIEESVARLNSKGGDSKIGTEVFDSIQNSDLSAGEKQEVFREVAKQYLQSESLDPQTFLRIDSKGTNFMAAYMREYAKDYFEAVGKDVVEKVNTVKIPEGLGNHRLPEPGQSLSRVDLHPEIPLSVYREMDEIYTEVGRTVIDSTDLNMHKLSPEARAFLKETSDVLVKAGHEELVPTLMTNTVVLRGSNPHVMKQMPQLSDPRLAPVLLGGTKIAQQYSNFLPQQEIEMSKNEAYIVKELRTPARLDVSRKQFENVSKDGSLEVSKEALDKEWEQVDESKRKAAEHVRMMEEHRNETVQKLDPYKDEFDRIAGMEAKLDRLNRPSLWDRIKAIPDGGIDKKKEKLIAQIDEAKMDLQRKVDPEGFEALQKQNKESIENLSFERMDMALPALDHQLAKMDQKNLAVMKAIEQSSMVPDDDVVRDLEEQMEKTQEVLDKTRVAAETFDKVNAEIKSLEKNVSVRDSFGKDNAKAPEGIQTKRSVK